MTKVTSVVLVSIRIKTSSLRIYFSSKNFLHVFWSSFVVQSLSCIQLFVTTWTAAGQASLSIIFQSLLKLMSIKSVMPSNYLILCHRLLLLTTILPSIRVFSNKSALCIRWPKYWSFSFSWSRSKLTENKVMLMNNALVAQRIKHLPAMQETWVWFLSWDDPLEKEMATHSSILAWRIPWTEEPSGLRSTGSQRVRHN